MRDDRTGRGTVTVMAEDGMTEEQRRPPEGVDPRVEALGAAVHRLRGELAAYPARLSDRAPAEEALAELDAMVCAGMPDVAQLRRSLLVVAAAVGSVSALAPAVAEVRDVIDLFGRVPHPRRGD